MDDAKYILRGVIERRAIVPCMVDLVFSKNLRNWENEDDALYIQVIDSSGVIKSFKRISSKEHPIISFSVSENKSFFAWVGDQALYALQFDSVLVPSEVVVHRGFTAICEFAFCANNIQKLVNNPLLGLSLAQFLKARELELHFAKIAADDLNRIDFKIAKEWFDNRHLSEDARSRLKPIFYDGCSEEIEDKNQKKKLIKVAVLDNIGASVSGGYEFEGGIVVVFSKVRPNFFNTNRIKNFDAVAFPYWNYPVLEKISDIQKIAILPHKPSLSFRKTLMNYEIYSNFERDDTELVSKLAKAVILHHLDHSGRNE